MNHGNQSGYPLPQRICENQTRRSGRGWAIQTRAWALWPATPLPRSKEEEEEEEEEEHFRIDNKVWAYACHVSSSPLFRFQPASNIAYRQYCLSNAATGLARLYRFHYTITYL